MRISVRRRRRWRMTSCPAANGMRWVKPSIATVSPSRMVDSTASARVRKRDMRSFPLRAFIYGAPSLGSNTPLSQRGAAMSLISSEPIFHVHAELADIRHFGQTPYGDRRVIDIIGGRVFGPKLQGRILPGADWQIVCPDGTPAPTPPYGSGTAAGARIFVNSDGRRARP